VTFTGLLADFFVLVAVFFTLGEASREDKSDDMIILWRKRKGGNFGYSDGRAEVVRQELEIPLLSGRDQSHVKRVCICL
jgi:hypothetical protein